MVIAIPLSLFIGEKTLQRVEFDSVTNSSAYYKILT